MNDVQRTLLFRCAARYYEFLLLCIYCYWFLSTKFDVEIELIVLYTCSFSPGYVRLKIQYMKFSHVCTFPLNRIFIQIFECIFNRGKWIIVLVWISLLARVWGMSMDWSRVVRCRSIFLSNSFVSEKIGDLVQSNLALRNFLVTIKKFLKVKSSLFQILLYKVYLMKNQGKMAIFSESVLLSTKNISSMDSYNNLK